MKQLDRLVAVLHERGAQAVVVAPNEAIQLRSGDRTQPLTREPVTAAQIEAILGGTLPAALADDVARGERVTYPYASPAGPAAVTVEPGPRGPSLMVRAGHADADGEGESVGAGHASAPGNGGGAGAPTPSAAPSAPGPSTSGGLRRQDTARVDALLRGLLESGGSDLHLRVGQPPILRKDGGLKRDEAAPLTAETVQSLLHSIMGERDIESFRETSDADFAYEIPGLARFRVNAAVDRNGPRGERHGVRTRVVLGEAERTDPFAGRQPRQVAPLLLLRAVAEEQRLRQAVRDAHYRRVGRVRGRDLLEEHDVSHVVQACSAVLLWRGHAEEPQFPHLAKRLPREAWLAVQVGSERRDLLARELSHR